MPQWNARSRLVSIFALACLYACGGGDGDGSISSAPPQRGGGASVPPPSAAAAAILNPATTREIAVTAIAELDVTEKPPELTYLPEIVARGKDVVANVESPCPEGGRLEESQSLDDDLTGTIRVAFRDCVQGGARQNGGMTIHIEKFDLATHTATQYRLQFEALTFSNGSRSAVAQGNAAVSTEGGRETITYDMSGTYSPEAVSSRLEDLIASEAFEDSGARRVTLAGRLIDSRHGYVDVSTLEELVFASAGSAAPSRGVLRLTGAQNATADIRFESARVRISLDADADGVVDAVLTTSWLELRDVSNLPPSANAGEDITIELGDTVNADASASVDWEGDALTYEWLLAGRPAGSAAQVSGTAPTVSFRPDVVGEYELQATVRDAQGGESSDRVRITVRSRAPLPPNLRPTANAGSDRITVEGQSVTLDGSRSRDPENDPLTFTWRLVRAPQGTRATVTATSPSVEFTPDLPGIYELRLTVSDGGDSDSDTVLVLADRLLRFTSGVEFRIRGRSLRGDDEKAVALRTSPHYRGAPIAVAIGDSAPWLIVRTPEVTSAAPGAWVVVQLELDRGVLESLRDGTYVTELTAVPAGGRRPAITEVSLRLRR